LNTAVAEKAKAGQPLTGEEAKELFEHMDFERRGVERFFKIRQALGARMAEARWCMRNKLFERAYQLLDDRTREAREVMARYPL
jgi:hypothetical protein